MLCTVARTQPRVVRTRGHDRAETETETARRAAPPLRSAAQLFKRRIAQALRAAARGRYEYRIYFDVFPVCTDWKPYKQTKIRVMRIHRHFLLSNDDFPYQTFTFERELCRSRMYFL